MSDLKRMRLLCGLSQIDIFIATGIPIGKLSLAERDLKRLSNSDEKALREFLIQRWEGLRQFESGRFSLPSGAAVQV